MPIDFGEDYTFFCADTLYLLGVFEFGRLPDKVINGENDETL